MFKKVYYDIDGVLADLMLGMIPEFNMPFEMADWPRGVYWIEDILNVDPKGLFSSVKQSFWEDLKKTTWFDDLLETIDDMYPDAEKFLLTSPIRGEDSSVESMCGCYAGKVQWMHNHLREFYDEGRFYISYDKYKFCHGPTDLLIDDLKINCDEWEMAGGSALHLPGYHNGLHPEFDYFKSNARKYITQKLQEIQIKFAAMP